MREQIARKLAEQEGWDYDWLEGDAFGSPTQEEWLERAAQILALVKEAGWRQIPSEKEIRAKLEQFYHGVFATKGEKKRAIGRIYQWLMDLL